MRILKKMRGDRFGTLFAHPVLEASDSVITPAVKASYKATIEHPMDYKTVKSKLDASAYQTPDEFKDDMLLIYDNCMKFNPPVGPSKWIYDAAESNKAKFEKMYVHCQYYRYIIIRWEAAQDKLARLLAKPKSRKQQKNEQLTMPELGETSSEYTVESVDTKVPTASEEPTAAHQGDSTVTSNPAIVEPKNVQETETGPIFRSSFRLSMKAIQEYRARREAMAVHVVAQQPPAQKLPVTESHVAEPVTLDIPLKMEDCEPVQPECHLADEAQASSEPVAVETIPENLPCEEITQVDDVFTEDSDAAADIDGYEQPPISTRREEGILRVNWLTENECNQLFPHCSIIGLEQRKPQYNVSDIALRSIYNEIYLAGQSEPRKRSSSDLLETAVGSDYRAKHHKMITFLLEKPQEPTTPGPCTLPEFGDGESTSMTDDDRWVLSPYDQDTVRDGTESAPSAWSEDLEEPLLSDRSQTLRIELKSEATVGVDPEAESILLKSGFSKVPSVNSMVKCNAEISFESDNRGYYKTEEGVFLYCGSVLRHIRLFLLNCGDVTVEITRRTLPLAQLVFKHGVTSAVHELYIESKKRNMPNIQFFQLPQAGAVSYAPCVDALWRLQTVNSTLPKPFIVLHAICRNIN
ncbi:Transcription factor GTE9 [Babesia sp. Xinjiang]|uniref:Transcription factor GTE9 n=1 Tax=Babesia sp. Xinjiang TaxID=462227 RepID=UPI000A21BF8F|nr:Transcription factor GTE9 [Babesia sp. Xinjiang]XP_028871446.1 Transcription factor GTE9 [Babesia sp. Xinjiang]ORM40839.1 Transcription factor GTE9 [Babesia sp. Xinjiang]ORM40990.1 Transcription factor GTE9 [Babesia sp. Xinjiang]